MVSVHMVVYILSNAVTEGFTDNVMMSVHMAVYILSDGRIYRQRHAGYAAAGINFVGVPHSCFC